MNERTQLFVAGALVLLLGIGIGIFADRPPPPGLSVERQPDGCYVLSVDENSKNKFAVVANGETVLLEAGDSTTACPPISVFQHYESYPIPPQPGT